MASKSTWLKHIEKIFADIPAEELQQYFRSEIESNARWRNKFLDRFSHIWDIQTNQKYRRTVEEAINRNKLNGQFVSRGKASGLAGELGTLLQLSDMQCAGGNWRDGFDVLCAILDVVVSKGWEMDDSYGAIGECIQRTLSQYKRLFEECQVGELKDEALQFSYQLAISDKHESWNVNQSMFDFLVGQSWSLDYHPSLRKMCEDKITKEDGRHALEILSHQLIRVLQAMGDDDALEQAFF